MDMANAGSVALDVSQVAGYGGQLAAVLHQYALIADRLPAGFEGAINILDATVATLKQILTLLSDEALGIKNGNGKKLFSQEGLKYVALLTIECATALAKIEPIVKDSCLDRREFKVKRKRDQKVLAKNGEPKVDITTLKLDEGEFLQTVENTRWSAADDLIEECMERLYELQLHLLLVFQVVTVGELSRDLSSGTVDIKSIVTYHERITRTADLVGIKPPAGKNSHRKDNAISDSDSSSGYDSASDSDSSSVRSLKSKKGRGIISSGIPPPPPGGPRGPPLGSRQGPPPPQPPIFSNSTSISPPPALTSAVQPAVPIVIMDSVNPPSYSESHNSSPNELASTLGPKVPLPSLIKGATPAGSEKTNGSSISDEKNQSKEKTAKPEVDEKPAVTHPRLFKEKPNSIGFRLKSLFRSRDSLAQEMKRTLSDSDSHPMAFVIQKHDLRKVPHSAFHSLETTHMRTILSQMNDNTWYKTFTTLNPIEHQAVHRLTHPWANGKQHEREVVVLKVLQQNRLNSWMILLSELLRNQPFPRQPDSRVILAIVREKFVDGKPLALGPPPPPPPPPTSPFFPPPPPQPTVRPAAPPPPPNVSRISDLRYPAPPPPPPGWNMPPRGPPFPMGHPQQGPPPMRGPAPPPGPRNNSVRVFDSTPIADADATTALTTYNEYRLQPADPIPPATRSWSRVTITKESAESQQLIRRVQAFQRAGGDVIENKLRLTPEQSSQVSRLMDEIKSGERDNRFEWCWVEISMHTPSGEITDFTTNAPGPLGSQAMQATLIHLVSKRAPQQYCKPLELYNLITAAPKPMPPRVLPQPPPILLQAPAKSKKYSSDSSSSGSERSGSEWSDDGSVGNVRRRLKSYRTRRIRRERRKANDSDSEDESDADKVKIKLVLRRGDDVVKALLKVWTQEGQIQGKVKGKA